MDMSFKRPQNQSAWDHASQKHQQAQCGDVQEGRKVQRPVIRQPARPALARTPVKIWHEGAD
jgi:hypothetical protein